MKIGIIGAGYVGSTTAYTVALQGIAREIILTDTNEEKAKTEALDIKHALPFFLPCKIQSGSYKELEGSDIIIITAGANQRPQESRTALLTRNIEIFRDIVHNIIAYAADSIIIVASNPVDIMTEFVVREAKISPLRIIGSGTLLDTARFCATLGEYLNVSPNFVHAYVIGEHGDSEVLVWSTAEIANTDADKFAEDAGFKLTVDIKNRIDNEVRNAAYTIIAGKKATYYGIAAAIARICRAIFHNENCILPISCHHEEFEGFANVSFSLPATVNRNGRQAIIYPQLSANERLLLHQSVEKLHSLLAN